MKVVSQLQALNSFMKKQLENYNVDSVMIHGVAGGNGLEHTEGKDFKKIYGVDINENYLKECAERYSQLEAFVPFCADLTKDCSALPTAELVIADLAVEYIGYENLLKVAKQVKSKYFSCVIQGNTDRSFVSASPYEHAFNALDAVHTEIDEKRLEDTLRKAGYKKILTEEKILPDKKKLIRFDFILQDP